MGFQTNFKVIKEQEIKVISFLFSIGGSRNSRRQGPTRWKRKAWFPRRKGILGIYGAPRGQRQQWHTRSPGATRITRSPRLTGKGSKRIKCLLISCKCFFSMLHKICKRSYYWKLLINGHCKIKLKLSLVWFFCHKDINLYLLPFSFKYVFIRLNPFHLKKWKNISDRRFLEFLKVRK